MKMGRWLEQRESGYTREDVASNLEIVSGDSVPKGPGLSLSLALLVYGALARLLPRCSGRRAFSRIVTDPSFRLGTQDLHSPIPSALKILNKEQEARHENPHAPEDEKDDTKILFAKANVIHNVRIPIMELASEVMRGQTPPPGEP